MDVTRITVGINSVILIESEALGVMGIAGGGGAGPCGGSFTHAYAS